MPKPLQFYRNDPTDGLPDMVRSHLDRTFLQDLAYLHLSNPKLLVVFSGGNSVGKTTLSRKIARTAHGLVIENDEIKKHVLSIKPDISRDDLNTTTWQYTMGLYERLPGLTSNGLVIRDGVIDWYFDRILPIFQKQGYKLFIVAYDISRAKRIELIRQRGDKQTVKAERLLLLLDDHEQHMANFRKNYTPDITLTDKTIFAHDMVVAAIQDRLDALA